jgi:phage shock protein C
MTCSNCQKDILAGSNFCYNCGAKQADGATPGMSPAPCARRRLMRSSTDKKIGGVCAGLADFLDIDPMIVRVVWILAVLCAGTGIIFYLVLWIVLPLAPAGVYTASVSANPGTV